MIFADTCIPIDYFKNDKINELLKILHSLTDLDAE